MNKSHKKWLIIVVSIITLVIAGQYLFKKEIGSVSIPSTEVPEEIKETASTPKLLSYLKVPDGFGISIFAKDLPGARVMEVIGDGDMLVSQTDKGQISLVQDRDHDGFAETKKVLLSKLNKPHGMVRSCAGDGSCALYIAEQDKISVYIIEFDEDGNGGIVGPRKKLIDLPAGATDRHFTRSLLWAPIPKDRDASDTLLISVGSSCNVCNEKNDKQAKILAYNIETETIAEYARGLRNAVFMARSPVDGKIWATEMGRDGLGDNVPPDEINIIEKGKNYGWPICYGKNIHDTEFDKNTYIRNPCMEPFETESKVDLQAHSAPLGLDFIPEEGWPEEDWYNLLVAYHGSWNRSVPTGYKIVRIKLDSKGNYLGTEDFITGFLDKNGKKNGRPVDIKILPGGTAYISDDEAGVIYRLYRTTE